MLRISNVSDWTGPRTRLATNVPALGDAAYMEALKMGLEPQLIQRYNGWRALEFFGSDAETNELLLSLPAALLEEAKEERRRCVPRPQLSRAQEWDRAATLVNERLAAQQQQAHNCANYIEARVHEQNAEHGEVELSNWEGGAL